MLRRIISVTVLVLTVVAVSLAQAEPFGDDHLVQVFYTRDNNLIEIGVDLGLIGTDFKLTDQNKTLKTVNYQAIAATKGATPAELNMGMYIDSLINISDAVWDHYFVTINTAVPATPNATRYSSLNSQANAIRNYFNGNLVSRQDGDTVAIADPAYASSYRTKMNQGNDSPGVYSGMNTVVTPGELRLIDISDGYYDLYLWHFSYDLNGGATKASHLVPGTTTDYVAVIRFYDNGKVVLNPPIVPIDLAVSPVTKDFGNVIVGSSSPQTFTLTSTGGVGLSLGQITIKGNNSDQFTLQEDNCSNTILKNKDDSCTLQVLFYPGSAGSKSATLTIPSNDADSPTTAIPLTGVGVANQPPAVGILTPGAASSDQGAAQTFTATYTDGNGAADLAIVHLRVSADGGAANAIWAQYDRAQNRLSLYDNDGMDLVGSCIPGTVATLDNGQGALDCKNTSVSQAGNTLTVNWRLDPIDGYTGMREVLMLAEDASHADSGWIAKGTWNVRLNLPPEIGSLAPDAASTRQAGAQTFTAVYTDGDGAGDLKAVHLLVSAEGGTANAIWVQYDRVRNMLSLSNNDGTSVVDGSCAPGTAGTLSNNQGSLDCASTSVTIADKTLTVNWRLVPNAGFTGIKQIKTRAIDSSEADSGWVDKGIWNIIANLRPTVATLIPSAAVSGQMAAKTFTASYSDGNGAADLDRVYLLVSGNGGTANAILAQYDRTRNVLSLHNNNGITLVNNSCTPGKAGTLSNSQGSLNCAATSANIVGNTLTVNWRLTPTAGFTGMKQVKLRAEDLAHVDSGWIGKGTWYINQTPAGGTLSPAAVASAQKVARKFTATYSDGNGVADLKSVHLRVSKNGAAANAMWARYDRIQNKLYLYNNNGRTLVNKRCTPGQAGTLSNSQGSLNCAATTVKAVGNTLTLTWSLTPSAKLKGQNKITLLAEDKSNANSGWSSKGTWTVK